MDLARLRTLRELAVRKTMAAVSEAMLVSPSAVSQQIAQLEAEAGATLVERRGRGVALTPAGERLVIHAEKIIGILEEAKTDIAELKRTVAGQLRLAAFPSVAAILIPHAIKDLEREHPQLRLFFGEREPTEGLAALRAWDVDVALIDDITVSGELMLANVETMPIIEDVLCAMLPADHPLARQETVSVADLRHERWAMDTVSNAYTRLIVEQCRAAGFEPDINGDCDNFEIVRALVEAGCSVSIMPGLRLRRTDGSIVGKKILPEIRRHIFAAYRQGEIRNPAIAACVRQLQIHARRIGNAA